MEDIKYLKKVLSTYCIYCKNYYCIKKVAENLVRENERLRIENKRLKEMVGDEDGRL